MSLPPRHSSMSSLSPVSSPVFQPTRRPLERHLSWVEQPKSPTPWDAAPRSPVVLVDDAFAPQYVQSDAHRKSLPEPSVEWRRQVSSNPADTPQATTLAVPSPTKAFTPTSDKPVLYGPPFRPAQPLTGDLRYSGTSSLPRNFSLQTSNAPMHRVSWKM